MLKALPPCVNLIDKDILQSKFLNLGKQLGISGISEGVAYALWTLHP